MSIYPHNRDSFEYWTIQNAKICNGCEIITAVVGITTPTAHRVVKIVNILSARTLKQIKEYIY